MRHGDLAGMPKLPQSQEVRSRLRVSAPQTAAFVVLTADLLAEFAVTATPEHVLCSRKVACTAGLVHLGTSLSNQRLESCFFSKRLLFRVLCASEASWFQQVTLPGGIAGDVLPLSHHDVGESALIHTHFTLHPSSSSSADLRIILQLPK